MQRSTLERLAPLTGVITVVLFVISFIISGEPPASDDSTEEVVAFFTENDGEQMAAAGILAWGSAFLVWFGASVRSALWSAEGGNGRLSGIAFAGFVMTAVGALIFAGVGFAAAETAGDVPDEVTQTLSVLNADFFFPLAGGVLLAMLATGIATVRHGGLPTPLGYLAIVIGILALTPLGFFSFLALGIWVLIASAVLYTAAQDGRQADVTAPPPPA